MNHFLHGVARAIAETFPLPEPIVEIGSYQVESDGNLGNLRSYFPGKKYIGIDQRPGPGVDMVGDVENLPFESGSVGTLLAFSTFEHVQRFWRGFDEIHRVLRPDGVCVISCPFYFRIHQFPSDYWRFTPEALNLLLEKYPQRLLGWHGAKQRPSSVWATAFGEKCPAVTEAQLADYRRRVHEYAREPQSLNRRLRYRIASLLCGRGPFASYLDHDRWEMQWIPAAA